MGTGRGRRHFAVIACCASTFAAAAMAAGAQAQVLLPAPQQPPPASPTPAAPAPTGSTTPPRDVRTRLSDERKLSTWAFVYRRVIARSSPSSKARRVKLLRTVTSDGTQELVLVLASLRRASGSTWLLVRLPMRPNNRVGWVPRSALGRLHRVRTFLRINRRARRATLYRRGRAVWRARVGVGKRGTPTPRGDFYVRNRLLPGEKDGIYGVFAFGTSAYAPTLSDWPGGGVVGIHGTNQPGLIPGAPSHGCVRVRNGPISRLRKLMPLGTPIRID